ncbi:WD40 repeat-like-containing domain protein [Ophiocordyceps camponoti-floridani]|uniref:WD40 repeat-like-containing domain protein n=1 Tax=Ophiocordyceps camponoti-floridani TaxID=2030778 RepID=A0A8H4QB16_9HYPO|nr:WD40 repeat-like-containing domain protein [Ophiocordyceps camponoti-floridani]
MDLNLQHGHKDLVQAVSFNTYGDRCATGSVDGKMRVFNRHRDATWRLCDTWSAHGGEVLELQWLPASVYPNLIASLGMEGWFRLWAEDPSAAPGRRFCSGRGGNGRPAFDTRSGRAAPYRSFSVKHAHDSANSYVALLATDGRCTVLENEAADNVAEYTSIDDFPVCAKPSRGEEVSFRVRFDPNAEPCYTALKAGVSADALALVVAAMHRVSIYRSNNVLSSAYGVSQTKKQFYLAVDVQVHRGLVRDVAWAPGNFRGYDVIATACQDGFARVFRLDTPEGSELDSQRQPRQIHHRRLRLRLRRRAKDHQAGQVKHTLREISRLDSHRTPVWRVSFDDDGHVLGSTGDDGRLVCYRQTAGGEWAKSSELVMVKARMAAP